MRAAYDAAMNTLQWPDGTAIPTLGLGTWRMGESGAARKAEVAAIRAAIDMGYRLFDSAEMYGEGGAEQALGQAIAEALRAGAVRREELFIVSKVYPHNASRAGVQAACARSRARLGLDQIDLYLLHWRGSEPLAHTVAGFQALQKDAHIRHWGVSNFDVDDMLELQAISPDAACNQVYFSLGQRGPEHSLLPWLRARRMPLMAYSPIDQGALARHAGLTALAQARGISAAQLALAWVLGQAGVLAIPKAVKAQHLADNLAAAQIVLSDTERQQLDALFPPPRRKPPLATT